MDCANRVIEPIEIMIDHWFLAQRISVDFAKWILPHELESQQPIVFFV